MVSSLFAASSKNKQTNKQINKRTLSVFRVPIKMLLCWTFPMLGRGQKKKVYPHLAGDVLTNQGELSVPFVTSHEADF